MSFLSSLTLYCPTPNNSTPRCSLQCSTTQINQIRPSFPSSHSQAISAIDGKSRDMSIYVVLDISNRYFVRSKADSLSHWYLCIRGACLVCGDANCDEIHISSEHRTKFCVRVRPCDDSQAQRDLVMIDKDKISITARKDYTVHISDTEDLKATTGYQGKTDLLFGDLRTGLFPAQRNKSRERSGSMLNR